MIPFGTVCKLTTLHLPERYIWRKYHGETVTVTEPANGNADTREQGFYLVRFSDHSVGHCRASELQVPSVHPTPPPND